MPALHLAIIDAMFYTMKAVINSAKLFKLQKLLASRRKKVATSVTVAGELIESLNLIVPAKRRSQFVEAALRRELYRRMRRARDAHDLAILNHRAEALEQETNDLLRIQADPFQ